MVAAIALDLGSTRIKSAQFNEERGLFGVLAFEAPGLDEAGLICQGNAEDYLQLAITALEQSLANCASSVPVGIASQRSTFVLWERSTGRIVTPLISWQDRRARFWCQARQEAYAPLMALTGLPLSPHYAGPKLACLFQDEPELLDAAQKGDLLFGTLETLLVWRLTGGKYFQTDISMAARTLMANMHTGRWDAKMLHFFGIPKGMLPKIETTWGQRVPIFGKARVETTISDQAASLFTMIQAGPGVVAVNLGTGGFVSTDLGHEPLTAEGYLTAPMGKGQKGAIQYAIEGTVNAIGPALGKYPGTVPKLANNDPLSDYFCLPDNAGVGSPYWNPDFSISFSRDVESLSQDEIRRIVMEGIIFRVCGIVNDFKILRGLSQLVISGGLSAESFIVQGIAALSELRTVIGLEPEATLQGAAALAAGKSIPEAAVRNVDLCRDQGGYLKNKFRGWKAWVDDMMKGTS